MTGTLFAEDQSRFQCAADRTASVRGKIQFHLARSHAMRQVMDRSGKIGYILMWLLGIPIPILLIIFLLRGCN